MLAWLDAGRPGTTTTHHGDSSPSCGGRRADDMQGCLQSARDRLLIDGMGDVQETAQDCTRITVALVPKAAAGLARLRERTGLSKTGLVNRALQAYGFVEEQMAAGRQLLIRAPDGTVREVTFL
jgi:hypothetical protein